MGKMIIHQKKVIQEVQKKNPYRYIQQEKKKQIEEMNILR
jgi:hypothetical protein